MSEADARAWWADVQHLRDAAERRQSQTPSDGPKFTPLSLVDTDDEAELPRGFRWEPDADDLFDEARPRRRRFQREPAPEVLELPDPPVAEETDRVVTPDEWSIDDVEFVTPRQGIRRTVTITGRPVSPTAAPGLVEVQSRRPGRRAVERVGPRPDRIAMWAVALGLLLVVVAMATASHP